MWVWVQEGLLTKLLDSDSLVRYSYSGTVVHAKHESHRIPISKCYEVVEIGDIASRYLN